MKRYVMLLCGSVAGLLLMGATPMSITSAIGNEAVATPGTAQWHPDGTIVKTATDPKIYVIESGTLRHFVNEEAFVSRGYRFDEVVLITDAELACYGIGPEIIGKASVRALYDGASAWLLIDNGTGTGAMRARVAASGWKSVLQSWGIPATTLAALPRTSTTTVFASAADVGTAGFRDGALVSETTGSAVYVISEGIAMPIVNWETYVALGFEHRAILEVDTGVINAVMEGAVGDCATDVECITPTDIAACGGGVVATPTTPVTGF